MKKKIIKVEFEDTGQDFTHWIIEWDEFFMLGQVIDCQPFQRSTWCDYFVLSGKPKVGEKLSISLSPDEEVWDLAHVINKVSDLSKITKPAKV